ncbi:MULTISPECIES: hypothetical protein [unclassified Streptomyces]|uniref:hypothetical protein n=1 Tax=unclassified Streptomyces TaxID=2593676 RepID=UPI003808DA5B
MSSKIPVRGGRKGQQHRATPDDLRSYAVAPASPVTVTRADGSVEVRPAKTAQQALTAVRRRGPAVCAMCRDAIEGKVWGSREQGSCRGKPVHPECEKKTRAFGAQRRAAKQQAKKLKAGAGLSLAEENRWLLATQDRIRELRRQRDQTR